ncbi:hypothetical protein KAW48_02840, partial [candidate division WOR-3 bacterium]|nr:hypothetical protein [candidate division WOR-3 bacterium]
KRSPISNVQPTHHPGDCFVASLLAMTIQGRKLPDKKKGGQDISCPYDEIAVRNLSREKSRASSATTMSI